MKRKLKKILKKSKAFIPFVDDGKIHFTREALIFLVIVTALLWWLIYRLGVFVGSLFRG